MTTIHIKTETSELSTHRIFNDDELIKSCVEYVKDKLLVNPPIVVYGKQVYQHRSIGFYSDFSNGYYYSGQFAKSLPLSEVLKKLLSEINTYFNTDYNGILVNKYCNGNDYIGAHSDNEVFLSNIGVVSLSYGASRTFRIRTKCDKKILLDIPTVSNEIIKMSGNFQKEYTHEIPIESKIKEERYSFTFRKHNI